MIMCSSQVEECFCHRYINLLGFFFRACSEEGEGQLRRAFFSATLATEVEEWCSLNLDNVASVTIGQHHTATDTIKQTLVYTGENTTIMNVYPSLS